jgi:hypothetical protein
VAVTFNGSSRINCSLPPPALLLPAVLLLAVGALLLVYKLPLLKPVAFAAVAAKACRIGLGRVGLGFGAGVLKPA